MPLYFLLIIKILVQIAFNNLSFNVLNTVTISLLCLLIGLGILGLLWGLAAKPNTSIYIVSTSNITEQHFLGYFSLFVLFALGYQIEFVSMAVVFAIILVFIGIVYIRNNLFYINPLLNLIGFSFYRVEYKTEGDDTVHTSTMIHFGKLNGGVIASAQINEYNFNVIAK